MTSGAVLPKPAVWRLILKAGLQLGQPLTLEASKMLKKH
jgi:hypothetical protein